LLRAEGPVEHAILFGFACSIGLLLALFGRVRARGLIIIACGLGTFLAFASAAVLSVVVGGSLLVYDRLLARVSQRWFGLIALTAGAFVMLFLVSSAPWGIIIRYLIFDPDSGYDRLYQWSVVSTALSPSPWFGLGFLTYSAEDPVAKSIDNMWLQYAIQYGIPGSVLIGLSTLGAASVPTSGPWVNLTTAESKLGTTLSIVLFLIVLVGFTVHMWGTDRILGALLMGVRAHLGALGRLRPETQADNPVSNIASSSEPTGSTV
jgi:hypothetical protein